MEIRRRRLASGIAAAPLIAGVTVAVGGSEAGVSTHAEDVTAPGPGSPRVASFADVVPAPVKARPAPGVRYTLTPDTRIYAAAGSAGAVAVGDYLAGILRRSTGYALPVTEAAPANGTVGPGVWLLLTGAAPGLGDEGYQLDLTADAAVVRANRPAGLFAGVQTLRQLLPPAIERDTVQPGPWVAPGGRIVDHPRYAYRSAMLDVARHFFPVATLKRYIDELALYKINHLHLHLTDDQGWRIVIDSWPKLTEVGGQTAVNGDPGGYYTQAEYRDLVAYAQSRHITIVPEIDMPGHVNAALTAYPELDCVDRKAAPYTGIGVGFSTLCVDNDRVYTFIDDVVRELAALTPGPYLHIGGDEADATPPADYARFMERVQRIVVAHGKIPLAWHQVVAAELMPSTVAQFWDVDNHNDRVSAAVARGTKLVLSPANHAYLDMKYNARTALGLTWAGLIEVRDAYDWNPGAYHDGVPASAVLGVEAPLWTETVRTAADIEYLAFPRLAAIAELGWSPASTHDWGAFRGRLAAQGPRWTAMGVHFYRSAQVPWAS
jgi:hexosaminidase